MRRAYSIKLGCLVDARDVDYDDCLEYDVVCEICRHRVYKGVRPGHPSDTHYLSHYAAQSDEARECELRIQDAITGEGRQDEDDATGIGRGQSLNRRLSVLRLVLRQMLYELETTSARKLVNAVPPQRDYRIARALVLECFRKTVEDTDHLRRTFEDLAERMRNPAIIASQPGIDERSRHHLTRLGGRTQIRWVMDAIRTLVIKESLPQLIALADCAWAFTTDAVAKEVARRSNGVPPRHPAERTSPYVGMFLDGLPYRNQCTDAAIATYRDLVSVHDPEPGSHDDDMTIIEAAILRVVYEMQRLLYWIDYTVPLPPGAAKAARRAAETARPRRR